LINGSIWLPNYQTSRSCKLENDLARELSTVQYLSQVSEVTQDVGHSFEVIFKPIQPVEILRIAAPKLANLEEGEFCNA
jgi:hypothetical protein